MKTINVDVHSPTWRSPESVIRRSDSVLNVGSAGVTLPGNCVNYDIVAKPGVNVVGDAHEIGKHFAPETFDVVVLQAVLQHCRDPRGVIEQCHDVLRPGGMIYIDAPFVQAYCEDQHDLWRFTREGLLKLTDQFEAVECGVSIAGASALAFYVEKLLDVGPRPVSYALRLLASIPMSVFARTQFNRSPEVSGAFWLTGRKA